MSQNLPPVPRHSPIMDESGTGLITPVWSDWLQKAFVRMGGHIANANDELYTLLYPVTTVRISDNAVTSPKLASDASVDANRAVTTNHIRDLAITTGKIADLAITAAKLAGSIAFSKLLSTDWTSSFAASGYQKLGTGLYVQWGSTSSLGSATTTTISFPTAFPNACRQVLIGVTSNSAGSTTNTGHYGTGNYTTTGFDLYNRTNASYAFNYMAIGN